MANAPLSKPAFGFGRICSYVFSSKHQIKQICTLENQRRYPKFIRSWILLLSGASFWVSSSWISGGYGNFNGSWYALPRSKRLWGEAWKCLSFFFISLTMYSCIPSLHIKGRPVLLDEFSTVNYGDITSRWLNCWGGEGSKTQQLRICFGPVMSQFQGPLTK